MKKHKNFLFIFSVSVLAMVGFTSCSKEIDNWSYPSSTITGQFLYKGQPLQLMGTASDVNGTNMLQLIQVGPGTWDPGFIKMFGKEDGTYTIKTFDGDYKLVITPGKGPWVPNTDTLRFSLQGEKTGVNFNVTPYFWISDYSTNFQDSVFTASFKLEQVVPTAVLERVVIQLGTTTIVDNTSRLLERAFTTLTPGTHTLSLDLKTLSATDKANLKKTGFVYARLGVKTRNVSDLLYSKTMPLANK